MGTEPGWTGPDGCRFETRPAVLENLGEVAHVEIAAAGWTPHVVVRLALGLAAKALACDLASTQRPILVWATRGIRGLASATTSAA